MYSVLLEYRGLKAASIWGPNPSNGLGANCNGLQLASPHVMLNTSAAKLQMISMEEGSFGGSPTAMLITTLR